MFATRCSEKHVPGVPKSHVLWMGWHCRTIKRKKIRCVMIRNTIRDHSTRFSLLNCDRRKRNRHIEILQVASATKN